MLRQEHTWTVLGLQDLTDQRGRGGLKLGLKVKFDGGDGSDHRFVFVDQYDIEREPVRLRKMLFTLGLFVTDILDLIEAKRLGPAMREYLKTKPDIRAKAELRYPRPGTVP
jgi:hypothetical protein